MIKLTQILCKLKAKWLEMLSAILDGSCGCIHTVTIVWPDPEWTECEGCKVDPITEEVDIAVFSNPRKMYYKYGISFDNASYLELLVNEENRAKLQDCMAIYYYNVKYEPAGGPNRCGLGSDTAYFSFLFKKV